MTFMIGKNKRNKSREIKALQKFETEMEDWLKQRQTRIVSPKSAKLASKHRNSNEKIEDKLLREGKLSYHRKVNMMYVSEIQRQKEASKSH